jgi:hypothetical protein
MYGEVHLVTAADLQAHALSIYVFDVKKMSAKQSLSHWKQVFGPDPTTIAPMFKDIRDRNPSFSYTEGLMALNWLHCKTKYSDLSSRYGPCEERLKKILHKNVKMIQALKKEKIEFKFKELKNLHHKANIDCANFTVNEYQDEPSAKQYDHKSHSCGLKYEACVAAFEDRIVWFEGPFLVSRHDLCVFRGAEEAGTPDENCDPSALLWVMDRSDDWNNAKDRLVGDSGYCGMPDKIVITKEEHSLDYKKFLGDIKTCGETLFKRLKSFAIL